MFLIRIASQDDTDALKELFRVCFNKEVSSQEWSWKYGGAPLGSSSFVAVDRGKIVAHYGGFRLRFYSRHGRIDAIQGCDVMTHPLYRAKLFSKNGVIVRIADAFFKANPSDLIFGFPSERHGRLKVLRLGFEKFRYINGMIKELRPRPRNLFIKIRQGWDSITREDIDRVWDCYRQNLKLSIVKDSNYIFWRYRDKPDNSYRLLSIRNILRRGVIGYAIVKAGEDNILQILELLTTDKGIIERFAIAAIEGFALSEGMNKIKLWMNPNEKTYGILREMGYEPTQEIPYIVRIFKGSGISGETFYNDYCYSMGDYDAS